MSRTQMPFPLPPNKSLSIIRGRGPNILAKRFGQGRFQTDDDDVLYTTSSWKVG